MNLAEPFQLVRMFDRAELAEQGIGVDEGRLGQFAAQGVVGVGREVRGLDRDGGRAVAAASCDILGPRGTQWRSAIQNGPKASM
ncbi:MAG TPA: hypothetical protein VGX97_08025 [bacterium]|nr:hypothetical protein [bacterium]